MSHHPRRRDGTYIRDQMCPRAYRADKDDFKKLEHALGELHRKNPLPYVLVQPIFGWRSDGRSPKRTIFKDMSQKGFLDPLTLHITTAYWQHPYKAYFIKEFMECVERNRPTTSSKLRIICDEYDIMN